MYLLKLWLLLGAFPAGVWSWSREGFINSILTDYSKFDQAARADTTKDGIITETEFTNSLYKQADAIGNNDNQVSRDEFLDFYALRYNISSELVTVMFSILNDPNSNDDIITSVDVSLSSFSGRSYATVAEFRAGLDLWLKQSADKLYTILMAPHVITQKQEPEIRYSVLVNSVDTNNDGVITTDEMNEEFKRVTPSQSVRRRDWVWRNNQRYGVDPVIGNLAFDFWDRNRDLELSTLDIQALREDMDVNGNNQVERDEFVRFLERGYKLSRRMAGYPLSASMIRCSDPWWSNKGWTPNVDAHRAAMDLDDDLDGWITLSDLRRWLQIFDYDRDGSISRKEYNGLNLDRYGINSTVSTTMFDLSDTNGDEKLNELDWEFHFQDGFSLSFCDARRSILDLVRMAEQLRGTRQGRELRDSMQRLLQEEWSSYIESKQRSGSSLLAENIQSGRTLTRNPNLCGSRITCYVGEYTEDWGQPAAWLWWGIKASAMRGNDPHFNINGQVRGVARPVGGPSNLFGFNANPLGQMGGALRPIAIVQNPPFGVSNQLYDQPSLVEFVSLGPLRQYPRFRRATSKGPVKFINEKSSQESPYFNTYHRLFSPFTESAVPTDTPIKSESDFTKQQSQRQQNLPNLNSTPDNLETSSPDQTDPKIQENLKVRTTSSTEEQPSAKSKIEENSEEVEGQKDNSDWLPPFTFLGYPVMFGFDPWMFGGIPGNWGMFGRKKRDENHDDDDNNKDGGEQMKKLSESDVKRQEEMGNIDNAGNTTTENDDDFEYWRPIMPLSPGFGMLPWDLWMAWELEKTMLDTLNLLKELGDGNGSSVTNETKSNSSYVTWNAHAEWLKTSNDMEDEQEREDVRKRQKRESQGNVEVGKEENIAETEGSNEGRERRFTPFFRTLNPFYWPLILNRWRRPPIPLLDKNWPLYNPNIDDYKFLDIGGSISNYVNPWSSTHNQWPGICSSNSPWSFVLRNYRSKRNVDNDKKSDNIKGDRELRSNDVEDSNQESFHGGSTSLDDSESSVWRSASKTNVEKDVWEQQANPESSQFGSFTYKRPAYTTSWWSNENLPTFTRPIEPGWWRNILSGTENGWKNVYPELFNNAWKTYDQPFTVGDRNILRNGLTGNFVPRTLFSSLLAQTPSWSDLGNSFLNYKLDFDGMQIRPIGEADPWSDFLLWADQWQSGYQRPDNWLSFPDTLRNLKDLNNLWKIWYGRFTRETNNDASTEDESKTEEMKQDFESEKTDLESEKTDLESEKTRKKRSNFNGDENDPIFSIYSNWLSWFLRPFCENYWSKAKVAPNMTDDSDIEIAKSANSTAEAGNGDEEASVRNVTKSEVNGSNKSLSDKTEYSDMNILKSSKNGVEPAKVDTEKKTKQSSSETKKGKSSGSDGWNSNYVDPNTERMSALWDMFCPLILQSELESISEDDKVSLFWDDMNSHLQFQTKREENMNQKEEAGSSKETLLRERRWQNWNTDDVECAEWVFAMSRWSPWKGWNLLRSIKEDDRFDSDSSNQHLRDRDSRSLRCTHWYRKFYNHDRYEDDYKNPRLFDKINSRDEPYDRNYRTADEKDDSQDRQKRDTLEVDRSKRQYQPSYRSNRGLPDVFPYIRYPWKSEGYPQFYQNSLSWNGPNHDWLSYNRWNNPFFTFRRFRSPVDNAPADGKEDTIQERKRRETDNPDRSKRFWSGWSQIYDWDKKRWWDNQWNLGDNYYNSKLPLISRFTDYNVPWFNNFPWMRQKRDLQDDNTRHEKDKLGKNLQQEQDEADINPWQESDELEINPLQKSGNPESSPQELEDNFKKSSIKESGELEYSSEITEVKQMLGDEHVGRDKEEAERHAGTQSDKNLENQQPANHDLLKNVNNNKKIVPGNDIRTKRYTDWDYLADEALNNWLNQFWYLTVNTPKIWQNEYDYWRYSRDARKEFTENESSSKQKREASSDQNKSSRQQRQSLQYNVPQGYYTSDAWTNELVNRLYGSYLWAWLPLYSPIWDTPFPIWRPIRLTRNSKNVHSEVTTDSKSDNLSRQKRLAQYYDFWHSLSDTWGAVSSKADEFYRRNYYNSQIFPSQNLWRTLYTQNRFRRDIADSLSSTLRSKHDTGESGKKKRWFEDQNFLQLYRSPWGPQYSFNSFPWWTDPPEKVSSFFTKSFRDEPFFFQNEIFGSYDPFRYTRETIGEKKGVKIDLQNGEKITKLQQKKQHLTGSSTPSWFPNKPGEEGRNIKWQPQNVKNVEDTNNLYKNVENFKENKVKDRHRRDTDQENRNKRWLTNSWYSPGNWYGTYPYSWDNEWDRNYLQFWNEWSRSEWNQARFQRDKDDQASSRFKREADGHKSKRWFSLEDFVFPVDVNQQRWISQRKDNSWSRGWNYDPTFYSNFWPTARTNFNKGSKYWEWIRDGSPWRYHRQTSDFQIDNNKDQLNAKEINSTKDDHWQPWNTPPEFNWDIYRPGLLDGDPWSLTPNFDSQSPNNKNLKSNKEELTNDADNEGEKRQKRWQISDYAPYRDIDYFRPYLRHSFWDWNFLPWWNNPYRFTFISNLRRAGREVDDDNTTDKSSRSKRSSKEDDRNKRWGLVNDSPVFIDSNWVANGIGSLTWYPRYDWWSDNQNIYRYRRNSKDNSNVKEDTERDFRIKRQNYWNNWIQNIWNRNYIDSRFKFGTIPILFQYPIMKRFPFLGIKDFWGQNQQFENKGFWNINQFPGYSGFWNSNGNLLSVFNVIRNWSQSPRVNGFANVNQSPWLYSFWKRNENQLSTFNRLPTNLYQSSLRNFRETPTKNVRDKRSMNDMPVNKRWDTVGMVERNSWGGYNDISRYWLRFPNYWWNQNFNLNSNIFGQRSYRATEDESANIAKRSQKTNTESRSRAKRFGNQIWNYQNPPFFFGIRYAQSNANNWLQPFNFWYLLSTLPEFQNSGYELLQAVEARNLRSAQDSGTEKIGDNLREKRETGSEDQRDKRWLQWLDNPTRYSSQNKYFNSGNIAEIYRPFPNFQSKDWYRNSFYRGQDSYPFWGYSGPWNNQIERWGFGPLRSLRMSDKDDSQEPHKRETWTSRFNNKWQGNAITLHDGRSRIHPWQQNFNQLWSPSRQNIPGKQWQIDHLNQLNHRPLFPRYKRSLFKSKPGDLNHETTIKEHQLTYNNNKRSKRWQYDYYRPQYIGSVDWQRSIQRQLEDDRNLQYYNTEWDSRQRLLFRRKRKSENKESSVKKRWGQINSSSNGRFSQFGWANPSTSIWRPLSNKPDYISKDFIPLQNQGYRDYNFELLQNPAYDNPNFNQIKNSVYHDQNFNYMQNSADQYWSRYQNGLYKRNAMTEFSQRNKRQAQGVNKSKWTENVHPWGESRYQDEVNRIQNSGSGYQQGGSQYPFNKRSNSFGERKYPFGESQYTDGTKYPFGESKYQNDESEYPFGGSKYPFSGSKYPNDGIKYPNDGNKYPFGGSKYPNDGNKYPFGGSKYPNEENKYPFGGNRYPFGEVNPLQQPKSKEQGIPNALNFYNNNRNHAVVPQTNRNVPWSSFLRPFRETQNEITSKTKQ